MLTLFSQLVSLVLSFFCSYLLFGYFLLPVFLELFKLNSKKKIKHNNMYSLKLIYSLTSRFNSKNLRKTVHIVANSLFAKGSIT